MDEVIPVVEAIPSKERVRFCWRTSLVLILLCFLGSVLLIPYTYSVLKQGNLESPPNMPHQVFWALVMIINIAFEMCLSVAAVVIGLVLGTRIGLGAPSLQDWLNGEEESLRQILRSWPLGLIVGVGSGVIIVVCGQAWQSWLPPTEKVIVSPPPWEGFLASIGAGIREEVWLRLGFMTLLVWLGTLLTGTSQPPAIVVWSANLLATMAFGAMHLPQARMLYGNLTGGLVAYVLLLNGIIGVVCGWLYWRKGLLSAMAAHFSADVVLKVILPLLEPYLEK